MDNDEEITGLKGDLLAQSGLISGLMVSLVQKQLFSAHDVREIYENALLTLEQNQRNLHADDQRVFAQARSTLEASLRSLALMRKSWSAI